MCLKNENFDLFRPKIFQNFSNFQKVDYIPISKKGISIKIYA